MDGSKPGFHTYMIPFPLGGNRWEWNVGQTKSYSTSPSPPVCEPPLRGKPLCFSSPPDDDFRRAECSSPERESSSWPQTVVTVRLTCPEARVVLVTFQNKLNSHREQPPP